MTDNAELSPTNALRVLLNYWNSRENIELAYLVCQNGPIWHIISEVMSSKVTNSPLTAREARPENFYSAYLCEKQYNNLLFKNNVPPEGHDIQSKQLIDILKSQRKKQLKQQLEEMSDISKLMEVLKLNQKLKSSQCQTPELQTLFNGYLQKKSSAINQRNEKMYEMVQLIKCVEKTVKAGKSISINTLSECVINTEKILQSDIDAKLEEKLVLPKSSNVEEIINESILKVENIHINQSDISIISTTGVLNEISDNAKKLSQESEPIGDIDHEKATDNHDLSSPLLNSSASLAIENDASNELSVESRPKAILLDLTRRSTEEPNVTINQEPSQLTSTDDSSTIIETSIAERAKLRATRRISRLSSISTFTKPEDVANQKGEKKAINIANDGEFRGKAQKKELLAKSEKEFITIGDLESVSTEVSDFPTGNKTPSTSVSYFTATSDVDVIELDIEASQMEKDKEKENEDKHKIDTFKRKALGIWNVISNHRHAHLFINPVSDNIPDYSKTIKKKVDLKSIKKRIKNEHLPNGDKPITSLAEFKAEILNMFVNAQMFNNINDRIVKEGWDMYDDISSYFDYDLTKTPGDKTQKSFICTRQNKRKQQEEEQKTRNSISTSFIKTEMESSSTLITIELDKLEHDTPRKSVSKAKKTRSSKISQSLRTNRSSVSQSKIQLAPTSEDMFQLVIPLENETNQNGIIQNEFDVFKNSTLPPPDSESKQDSSPITLDKNEKSLEEPLVTTPKVSKRGRPRKSELSRSNSEAATILIVDSVNAGPVTAINVRKSNRKTKSIFSEFSKRKIKSEPDDVTEKIIELGPTETKVVNAEMVTRKDNDSTQEIAIITPKASKNRRKTKTAPVLNTSFQNDIITDNSLVNCTTEPQSKLPKEQFRDNSITSPCSDLPRRRGRPPKAKAILLTENISPSINNSKLPKSKEVASDFKLNASEIPQKTSKAGNKTRMTQNSLNTNPEMETVIEKPFDLPAGVKVKPKSEVRVSGLFKRGNSVKKTPKRAKKEIGQEPISSNSVKTSSSKPKTDKPSKLQTRDKIVPKSEVKTPKRTYKKRKPQPGTI